ncbi:MAG: OsmC family protein [Rhodothermales bacterium]
MPITIERIDDAFHFVGTNPEGNTLHMDLTPEEGGTGQGYGPMQMVATALGGCSAIDIILILRKGRQTIESFSMTVDTKRATDQTPAVFTHLHVTYTLTGAIDPVKARRAVELSIEKYCSVSKMLEKTAEITFDVIVNGEAA